jgi:hypothetical protein
MLQCAPAVGMNGCPLTPRGLRHVPLAARNQRLHQFMARREGTWEAGQGRCSLHRRSPLLAQPGRAAHRPAGPVVGVEPTCRVDARHDAIDPERPSAKCKVVTGQGYNVMPGAVTINAKPTRKSGYSIRTSSARTKILVSTLRPSALAVLRLSASSMVHGVGCPDISLCAHACARGLKPKPNLTGLAYDLAISNGRNISGRAAAGPFWTASVCRRR